jgi:hypothetical protein
MGAQADVEGSEHLILPLEGISGPQRQIKVRLWVEVAAVGIRYLWVRLF